MVAHLLLLLCKIFGDNLTHLINSKDSTLYQDFIQKFLL